MASPVHPAIGHSYGAACDAWLLQPKYTVPSTEVIQQFDPESRRQDSVVSIDVSVLNLLRRKRVAVQDALRINEMIGAPPELLLHTDVRIFRRKLIRDALDPSIEPSWLDSHKALLAFIRSHHGADWKPQHTLEHPYTVFDVSHLDTALAEWERNMDTMRANLILYVSLFSDLEQQRLAMQRIMQTHAEWVDIVEFHVALLYHPPTPCERRERVADEIMLWWAKAIQPTPSAVLKVCLAHMDWGLPLPMSCLLNTLRRFDGTCGWPRWASVDATVFLVELANTQLLCEPDLLKLLMYAIKFLVPIGHEVTTVEEFRRFIRPLFSMMAEGAADSRFEFAVTCVATCSDRISDQFMAELAQFVPSEEFRQRLSLIWTGVTFANQLQNDRMNLQVHALKDNPARKNTTKKEYTERALCIICAVNERHVCFVPCGHIIACAGCSSQLPTNQCPACRAPISHMQRILF
jgi:hypothetical protein